jgi:hypothetical protein
MRHPLSGALLLFPIAFSTVLSSCDRPEDRSAETSSGRDTGTAGDASHGGSATISLAQVAGKWKLRSTGANAITEAGYSGDCAWEIGLKSVARIPAFS